jgi:biopolymer transport protein ExbD
MAHSLDSGRKGSVNIELNIVPFIDVMSCLTAFLLVTAVWIATAELPTTANAPCAPGAHCDFDPNQTSLSILVESDEITVARHPDEDARHLASGDWNGVAAALRMFAGGEHPAVDIAARSVDGHAVSYQALVTAVDTSVRVGLTNTRVVTDPDRLTGAQL